MFGRIFEKLHEETFVGNYGEWVTFFNETLDENQE